MKKNSVSDFVIMFYETVCSVLRLECYIMVVFIKVKEKLIKIYFMRWSDILSQVCSSPGHFDPYLLITINATVQ